MNKILFGALLLVIVSCTNTSKGPDVSGIAITLTAARFDNDFFGLDTNRLQPGLQQLQNKYPVLLPVFLQGIVGVADESGIRSFYQSYRPVYDSAQKLFKDFAPYIKQVATGLKYVKHYFPAYEYPRKLVPVVGPMQSHDDLAKMTSGDYTAVFMGQGFVGVSLQFYLGHHFSFYQQEYFINNVAPLYRSRRFDKAYIAADVMRLIVDDLYPDNSATLPLVEQMIEKGKRWWLLDKLMPEADDSIKTGYTGAQVAWCKEYEGNIWSTIIKSTDLRAVDPPTIQTYIGESPFTQTLSQEFAPGNLGPWIGWQIVKKYEARHTGDGIDAIMKAKPQLILDEAKYKPK